MDTLEVLIPHSKKINLSIGEYEVKKLSIRQIFRLGKFYMALLPKMKEEITGTEKNDEFLLKMFSLAEDKLPELLQIILNAYDDNEFLKRAEILSVEDLSEIVLAVSETTDLKKITGNFTAAMGTKK